MGGTSGDDIKAGIRPGWNGSDVVKYRNQMHTHKNKTKESKRDTHTYREKKKIERATNFVVCTNELNFLVFLESRGFVAQKLLLILKEREAPLPLPHRVEQNFTVEIMKFYPRTFSNHEQIFPGFNVIVLNDAIGFPYWDEEQWSRSCCIISRGIQARRTTLDIVYVENGLQNISNYFDFLSFCRRTNKNAWQHA